jgi:5-methylcytosine-specific restriction protein A
MRDELILALDLYFQDGRKARKASCEGLSEILRSIPVEPELAEDPKFRNWKAVYAKLQNFTGIDPEWRRKGFSNGSDQDQIVWDDFSYRPAYLRGVAEAILDNLGTLAPPELEPDGPDLLEDAPEGRILTRLHSTRERSAKLRAAKKKRALAETGRLACEGCDVDFQERYGERGTGFIECHHLRPLSTLQPGQRTRLEDVALLCSNCHRMVHVRQPWLSVEELIEIQRRAARLPSIRSQPST